MNGSTYRSRSRMKEAATYDSYFGSRLAAQAAGDDVAAPATIESLYRNTLDLPDARPGRTGARRLRIRARSARRPVPPHRSSLHHSSARGRRHPRRHAHGPSDRDGRAAARRDRRHRHCETRARQEVRPRGCRAGRRRQQADDDVPLARRSAGGELPEDGHRDGQRSARHSRQARRSPAQHAHGRRAAARTNAVASRAKRWIFTRRSPIASASTH